MDTTPHAPPTTELPTLADRREALGRDGENVAAIWLATGGMQLLDRNWRLASGELRGELDLILTEGDTLVVVEVKTRRSRRFGGPLMAVTPDKQAKIRALAAAYLRTHRPSVRRVRFDVVGVVVGARPGDAPEIEHVPAAF